jgi:hypothetical protein
MQRLTRWLTTLTFAFAMVACGGGSDGGGGANQPAGLLAGEAGAPALAAVVNQPAQPAADADIVNGSILTRLDVVIAVDATVGQVNTALGGVGATIAAMRAGTPVLTIAVPRQANGEALSALAATLEAQPGILAALPGVEAVVNVAPPSPADVDADFLYLQRARFPSAWNARAAAVNCASNRVTVVVADAFHRPIDALYAQFAGQVPAVADLGAGSAPADGFDGFHGYDVLTTLAANLDATVPTGANPFPDCMDFKAVQVKALSAHAITVAIESALAASNGKVVVNASFGWDACGVPDAAGVQPPCTAANLNAPTARARAIWAGIQRMSLAPFASRALVVASAGNEADKPVGTTYVGAGIASFGPAFNIAATADSAMSFASNTALWEPTVVCATPPCLPSLTATAADVANIASVLANLGQASAPRAANVLIAGSAEPFLVQGSAFSEPGATVLAVGEGIPTLLGIPKNGTSFAAPQVAALAAYLWMLSPDLRVRPMQDTVNAIQANASNGLVIDGVSIADGLINAYASVLSLDQASTLSTSSAPMRLAILDVNGDGNFNLADLQAYHAAYLSAGMPRESSARDYSRHDLNGDGFTGGSRTTRMDLDPNGSARFGAPLLNTLDGHIDGGAVTYDERAITDAQALCFFATSGLYSGSDVTARDTLLKELCPTASSTRSNWLGTITSTNNGPRGTLDAQLDIFPDGSFAGTALAGNFNISGRIVGNSVSFGSAVGGTDVGTFAGTIDDARTQMSGTWQGRDAQGRIDSGTWAMQRCTARDTPVVGC